MPLSGYMFIVLMLSRHGAVHRHEIVLRCLVLIDNRSYNHYSAAVVLEETLVNVVDK